MPWIKRNLFFVIGAAVAVILLGLAGYYLFAQWSLNNENSTKLEASYADLKRIADLQPNPGNEKVDNSVLAREHRVKVRAVIDNTARYFKPIPALPPGTNVSAADFSGALRKTIDELTRNAAAVSVTLQPKYDFSFAAQKAQVRFAAGTLEPLAAQLGEVKAICDVLFKAKINTLYNLRRVRVSEYDVNAAQSDYLETSATTNDLAILVPYEVTFYGFSGELAAVLTGFASNNHGFLVTTLNVEPGMPSATPMMDPAAMAMMDGRMPMDGRAPFGAPQPAAQMGAGRGALPVMLDERQLKVTMGVSVVKLLPKK